MLHLGFGKQWARGRQSENSTLKQCVENAVAIRAQKCMDLDCVRGNCRRKRQFFDGEPKIDDTPLPKYK